MDRLTGDFKGASMFATAAEARIYNRLRRYEDTGLTPDEIVALRAENERYKADIEAGRLVRLNVEPEEDYDGLKVKYRVFKVKDGTPVENCFVLRPEEDPAAFSALMAYAKNTENDALKDDLVNWGVAIIKREQEAARAAMEGGQHEQCFDAGRGAGAAGGGACVGGV
jgi:hypothetical protein